MGDNWPSEPRAKEWAEDLAVELLKQHVRGGGLPTRGGVVDLARRARSLAIELVRALRPEAFDPVEETREREAP